MKAISEFSIPACKRQLMQFLGMADYYWMFCNGNNFSVIAESLTKLLSKCTKFVWNNDCLKAFDILKAILKNESVVLVPHLQKNLS